MEYITYLYSLKNKDMQTKLEVVNDLIDSAINYGIGDVYDKIIPIEDLDDLFEITSDIFILSDFLRSYNLISKDVKYFTMNMITEKNFLNDFEVEIELDKLIRVFIKDYIKYGNEYDIDY